ncbi:hypothetical protein [Streptomyces sp. NPDC127084]|uniref:hypothetical protein n=1 Tax=Streptomyces sp. NPDC127084 TaxID=3347133 RepID=UPI00365CEA5D
MKADQSSTIYEALVFNSYQGYFDRRYFNEWHGALDWLHWQFCTDCRGVFDRAIVLRLSMDSHGFVQCAGRVKFRAEDLD